MDGMVRDYNEYERQIKRYLEIKEEVKMDYEDDTKAAMAEVPPPQSRYRITANKSSYVNEGYETLEEATQALVRLASEGYTSVSLHDTSDEFGGLW